MLLTRRNFLQKISKLLFLLGSFLSLWKLLLSLKPRSKNDLQKGSFKIPKQETRNYLEVSLENIAPGEIKVVQWQKKPIFIYHRTLDDLASLQKSSKINHLIEPQDDSERVDHKHPEWLVVVGVCTHLGCIPRISQHKDFRWVCPCHGSTFDISGRVLKGPASKNLAIPQYDFKDDNTIILR